MSKSDTAPHAAGNGVRPTYESHFHHLHVVIGGLVPLKRMAR